MDNKIDIEELRSFVKRGAKEYEIGLSDSQIDTMTYGELDTIADDIFYLDGK